MRLITALFILFFGFQTHAALKCPFEDINFLADSTDAYLCLVKKPNSNYVSEICVEAGTLSEDGQRILWVRTSEIDKEGRLLQTGYMNKTNNSSPSILARVRNSRRFISASQSFTEAGSSESLRLDKRRLTYRFKIDNRDPKLRTEYSGNCNRK